MKLASFHVGLHLILSDVPYRIERIFTSGVYTLERLSDRALLTYSKEELIASFVGGFLSINGNEVEKATKKNHFDKDLASLTDIEQREILRKKEYVTAACHILGETPTKINLDIVIKNTSEAIDDKNMPSLSSVVRWWKKWNLSAQDLMSLANKKRNGKFFKKNGTVEKIINEIIERDYLTPQKTTKQNVYNTICNRISELNKVRLHPLRAPSRAKFYRICQRLDKYECIAAREGKAVADRQFRVTGLGVVTKNILERVEVDHTPLDVMVVNAETGLVDGRPWLTVLLDRHSRMPLGMEIGFEPPSEVSVMRALRNSIVPKYYVKEKYPQLQHEWPAYGIPMTLVCDNGLEFHATNLKRICMELNIELQFCPKKEPNYKGTVERFQGHLNRSVCHRIPGTTFSNISQRGEYHSEKMAKITLNELKKLIHEWIIEIYNHEINRTTQRIPYAIWCDGINIREPLLPESIQQLDLIFTKEYTRKLNHEGILLYGLHYNSAELAILRKRYYQSYDVKVRFDPANIQSVWVYDDVNGDYINVRCTEIDYSTELSLKEHLLIRSMKWKQGKSEQDSLSLMKSKEEFTEHLHELSNSKKIRPRQQAARHTLHKKDKREEPFKTNELERKYTLQKVEWNLDKIPKFQTSQREDL